MSYDFSIMIDSGGSEPGVLVCGHSQTWNVKAMYFKAIDEERGIRFLNGMLCETAKPVLRRAILTMQDNPSGFKKLNPGNGSGSYEGALETLQILLEWCLKHPKGYIDIW